MKQNICDGCGDEYILECLTVDRDTGDWLCPSCYGRSRTMKADREVSSAFLFIIGVIVVFGTLGYVVDLIATWFSG